jgi:mono/diheme cytochrome c family protein
MEEHMAIKVVLVVAAVLLVGFVAIQFVPVQRTNPLIVTQLDWDSAQTQALAQRACMDCHSNETRWPWYAYVAPVSWLVAHDVEDGRREMNFSQLSMDANSLGRVSQRIQRAIQSGNMPPAQYFPTHPDARLTADEKLALIAGMQKTLSKPPLSK